MEGMDNCGYILVGRVDAGLVTVLIFVLNSFTNSRSDAGTRRFPPGFEKVSLTNSLQNQLLSTRERD
jgi:hypothetical protein